MKKYVSIIAYLVLLIIGCMPSPPGTYAPGRGMVAVQITPLRIDGNMFLPDIDTAVARYLVTGAGPGDASFQAETADGRLAIDSLPPGVWNIATEATNDAGDVLGRGERTVALQDGQTANISMNMYPQPGTGTLDLAVLWDSGAIVHPLVTGCLIPFCGAAIELRFTIRDNQSAACRVDGVPAGYYLALVKLYDGGVYMRGVLSAAWITAGRVTTGTIDFRNGAGGGALVVTISPETAAPLTVTMSGQAAELPRGRGMTVSAAADEAGGNVVYLWYLNGVNVGTDRTIEVGSDLEVGVYRLDVTSFTADGERAGSATATFHVTAGTP